MRFLRCLVACMLLLAVPLQGMAAASMVLCGAQPHGEHAVATEQHEHHHDSADADHHAAGKPVDLKCSACAACCHGAAITESPRIPAFSVPACAAAPASTTALRIRATPPPDKPPRA